MKKKHWWFLLGFVIITALYLNGSLPFLAGFNGSKVGSVEVVKTPSGCEVTYFDVNGYTNREIQTGNLCRLSFSTMERRVRVYSGSFEVLLGLNIRVGWDATANEYTLSGYEFVDEANDSLDLYLHKPLKPTIIGYTTCWNGYKYYQCPTMDWGDCVSTGFGADIDVPTATAGDNASGRGGNASSSGGYCNWQQSSNIYGGGCMGSCIQGSGDRLTFDFYNPSYKMYGTLMGGYNLEFYDPFKLKKDVVDGLNRWSGVVYLDLSKFALTTTTIPTTTLSSATTTTITSPQPPLPPTSDERVLVLLTELGVFGVLAYFLFLRKK